MLVCHCNGVSDRTIRRVVREGASTVGQVSSACGAGACCQGCRSVIGDIIQLEHRVQESALASESLQQTGVTS